MDYVYVLTIRPPGSQVVWEVAFNRPPTTEETICHIQDQLRIPPPVDVEFALSCIEALKRLGVPEHYRAGSQGTARRGEGAFIELSLMRLVTLPYDLT